MSQVLVLNHHSLPFDSIPSAKSAIPEFLKICVRANNLGLSSLLIDDSVDKTWFRLQLAANYCWQDWYNQNNDDLQKDLIRAFRSIQTRQPFFSSKDIGEGLSLFEVKLNGCDDYVALCAAVWYESPMVSFPTRNPWNTSPIQVDVNKLEDTGVLVALKTEIINMYSFSILQALEPGLVKKRNLLIKSGKKILEKQNENYPFIEFCGASLQQLKNWTHPSTLLEQVKETITALNIFSEKWATKVFDNYSHDNLRKCGLNHNVSGESDSVLRNTSLRKHREFWTPQGKRQVFEYHVKLSNGFRVHFFPDETEKVVYVGYIGPHLPLE